MTALLQQAIAAITKLPGAQQDAIARRLLLELADDAAWEARFAATTDAQWDHLTAQVRHAIATGATETLESVFPPPDSRP
ncbi:hypothetical protein EYB53_016870 [Candidatus Chloroploca sp. M-50]|uniref:Uncharacterized protein n=1 Tax=Candidatus Chloroploca mongolica TaxID=2528176 RepID=A0ABS4DD73_9CHLR|nr:hypothetical protein [Candidatus Chloroploca mongolica]MBP1467388.1 hypothetical protein [Candidatus Chloroploca mongolica]